MSTNGRTPYRVRGFATIDFETTGILPERHERAVEISVVHSDPDGTVTGQWETLINPDRDMGPQSIHGISSREILRAPRFGDIASELVDLLSGRVVVGHNAAFDLRFLNAELGRLDYWSGAPFVSVCTMQTARELLGGGLSLIDCCAAFDIELSGAHRASVDALATARLLEAFIGSTGRNRWDPLLSKAPGLPPLLRPRSDWYPRESAGADDVSFLERIAVLIPDVSESSEQAEYVALVERCLLDRYLSEHEKDALVSLAAQLGISRDTAAHLHLEYFRALAGLAWADGVLTEAEQADLRLVADLLSIGGRAAAAALQRPPSAPPTAAVGTFLLEPGDVIALTGEMSEPRQSWFDVIVKCGYVPKDAVTKQVKVLVAADPDSLSGKAKKARQYGIPVIGEASLAQMLGASPSL